MDLILNKPISHKSLQQFLLQILPDEEVFLIYDGVNGWEDAPDVLPIMHYQINEDIPTSLKYGLSVITSKENETTFITNFSAQISKYFKCSVMCEASGVLLNKKDMFYALLFEPQSIFLVDDRDYEETGLVTKIIKLDDPYFQLINEQKVINNLED